jgi:hypothetical protein
MGGIGSSRWVIHDKQRPVDECLQLTIRQLSSDKQWTVGKSYFSRLSWVDGLGELIVSISYHVHMDKQDRLWIRLKYTQINTDRMIDITIGFTQTIMKFGRPRWWFLCPLLKKEEPCERRVGILYLPPGEPFWGCRHCFNLTYRSCQESHMYRKQHMRKLI